MAAGGGDGREPTDGIKGIVAGESNGIGETGADDDTGGGERTERQLPAGAAALCPHIQPGAYPREWGEPFEPEDGGSNAGTGAHGVSGRIWRFRTDLCGGRDTDPRGYAEGWLIREGLRQGKRRRHVYRSRRNGFGELLQVDGSHHDWFYRRQGTCCLIPLIADRTNTRYARFVEGEPTAGAPEVVACWIQRYGIPPAR